MVIPTHYPNVNIFRPLLSKSGRYYCSVCGRPKQIDDDELLLMASNEGALASMLYEDLQASWPEAQEETWKIADTIAAACVEAQSE